MARTRAGMGRRLDAAFYPRGPTGVGYNLPSFVEPNAAHRWALSGLVSLAIVVPLIAIFWDTLLQTFGIGMAPVGAAILIALVVAHRHPHSLVFKANRWLSLVALGALTFGCLSFFRIENGILADATLGGDVGMAIIGGQDAVGVLRLVGIGLAAIYLVAPRPSWRATRTGLEFLVTCATVVTKGLLATATWIREAYTRRQVRGWVDAMNIPAMHRGMGVGGLSQEVVSHDLYKELPPEDVATTERTGLASETPPAEAPSEAKETQPVAHSHPLRLPKVIPTTKNRGEPSESGLPTMDLLEATSEVELTPADNQRRAELIEEALASHGIEVTVAQINPGPTVTQFGVEPGWFRKTKEVRERDEGGKFKLDKDGKPIVRIEEVSRKRVKVDQIAALDKDLALAMAAPSIRIEAPVPGKSLVGIEVPNAMAGLVGLREALESSEFQRLQAKSNLALALGKGSAGEVVVDTLARMPHLLIAGATGSGKSVCITSLISCLLMHNTPRDVRFVLVDPKRVELVAFSTLPHLITPIIVDIDKVVGALKWVGDEMDRRYKAMAFAGARNIEGYNKKVGPDKKVPYLVVVIDELADLMSIAPFDVEQSLTRLAQMGRATGIHLIVATQRPSVDVITGLIKANFPTRISFAVTSMMDSRVILDTMGAEKLLGRGDMLYLPSDASKPRRLQGVYLSDQEVDRIVYFWTNNVEASEPPVSLAELDAPSPSTSAPSDQRQDEDPYLTKARTQAMDHNSISASLLQRRLGIGYPRAARLLDQLEEEGVVAPGEPGKSRTVLKQQPDEEADG